MHPWMLNCDHKSGQFHFHLTRSYGRGRFSAEIPRVDRDLPSYLPVPSRVSNGRWVVTIKVDSKVES